MKRSMGPVTCRLPGEASERRCGGPASRFAGSFCRSAWSCAATTSSGASSALGSVGMLSRKQQRRGGRCRHAQHIRKKRLTCLFMFSCPRASLVPRHRRQRIFSVGRCNRLCRDHSNVPRLSCSEHIDSAPGRRERCRRWRVVGSCMAGRPTGVDSVGETPLPTTPLPRTSAGVKQDLNQKIDDVKKLLTGDVAWMQAVLQDRQRRE